ncbi:uncharacterized protein LACBIDRAFT_336184 [Laccaria bicolor S238N-H82]|uniref:Predicted protein n=1 Tax=Laccaria bicolor (strain S238N-H82 / ATCC MYA-4686) TaxID=486041 RepID=B0E4N2_LACBS|nr:uncharacterized protein LACBIDRAFT_336184 [Laccaria bicolor S238N-H82]EDQ98200.1 predicted protein [Laccaria bicolor S238N-H82]|eukprot:XP_001891151.1 predicted protein [Laccaria bicolor S238N-H82]
MILHIAIAAAFTFDIMYKLSLRDGDASDAQPPNNVDTSFGEHQWAVVIFNGLHTSRTRQRHSTVFGFVQGGERFYFQCWAAHIFEDGRTEMFSDYDRELDLEDLTPITFVARNGSVAHTVIYETDGWYTME